MLFNPNSPRRDRERRRPPSDGQGGPGAVLLQQPLHGLSAEHRVRSHHQRTAYGIIFPLVRKLHGNKLIISSFSLLQHAYALELLKDQLKPGMRALDVGSGSGYLTACFALMVMQQETLLLATRYHFFRLQVGENGLAVGIDHVDELVKWSEENVRKGHGELLDKGRLKFVGKRF